MRRGKTLFALVSLLFACLGSLACEGTSEEEENAAKVTEEWAWLEQAKAELNGKREELTALRQRIANGVDEETESASTETEGEDAEPPATAEELQAQADALQEEIYGLADAYNPRLFQFINDQGIGVDSEPTEIQRAALAMKSDEDMVLAKDYIDRGGEYQRAIDIYNQALLVDPDNEELAAAKAHAEDFRYMSEERMAQVKNGMGLEEVRALLGTPRGSNVRDYENEGVGWFYPKAEPGTAAAIFFQKKKGELKVYKADFNAIKANNG